MVKGIKNIKDFAFTRVDNLKKEFQEISDFIFKNPELGNEEFISSRFIVDKMEGCGFKLQYPYCGLETAFRAEFGDDEGPVIAFLAEYDALPGYGDNGELGHACGHNWISATTVGAAMVLLQVKEELNFKGKIVLIGTPAEETTGGKCNLVESGAFKDIDVAFQLHLEAFNNLNCKALAMDSIEFNFKGKAAHAASHPHLGVNALDSVQLMFAGVNALRQHVKSDVRIHGIVTQGGVAPNIVPDLCQCKFYIRANERKYLIEVTEKVINCARGAAIMTGSQLDYRNFENPYDNIINITKLQSIMMENMNSLGINDFVVSSEGPTGSTDIGNVSQVCPTMYGEMSLDISPMVYVHEKEFLDHANSEEAYEKMQIAIKSMVGSALDIYFNTELLKVIKEEFNNKI
ncbi:MAG: M20 family metallopeptidase [Clostridium sp.]|uniref:M20 family metallopeptidase n=1 Tax=Clostridium sp. TaxID=1506 RepID=UPI0030525F08